MELTSISSSTGYINIESFSGPFSRLGADVGFSKHYGLHTDTNEDRFSIISNHKCYYRHMRLYN